jgi:SAM-dependent methyltransferase
MNPNKTLWEKGDFTRIARSMRESGEALVQSLGLSKGLKVLDLGCGDGTTALPAARLGADLLGVDIAQNLVDAGNRRAKEHGLTNCKFQEGDASNLQDLEDQAFDLVVSIFGAMFAPKPFDVAREMVRVTRPGGRVVMGNWIPGHPTLVAPDSGSPNLRNQFVLHAAAAGGLRQPDDLGDRKQCDRTIFHGRDPRR